MFHGEFEHSLDAKRRLAIPAGFRDLMNLRCAGDTLLAAPGANGSLWLWPERFYEQATESLRKPEILPDQETARKATYVFSRTASVPFDSAGRIRIPDRLLEKYGLESQAVVLGVGLHLEVMTPEEWRRRQELDDAELDMFVPAGKARGG
jgi:MraZ protein